MRGLHRVIAILTVLPALALAVAAPAWAMRCQMTGQVTTECCCPEGEAPPAAPATLTGEDCCQGERLAPVSEPTEAARFHHAHPPARTAEALVALPDHASSREAPAPERGARGLGPPLFLLRHAFLI